MLPACTLVVHKQLLHKSDFMHTPAHLISGIQTHFVTVKHMKSKAHFTFVAIHKGKLVLVMCSTFGAAFKSIKKKGGKWNTATTCTQNTNILVQSSK